MKTTKQPIKIHAICDNCGKAWTYTGSNKIFVTCPDCRKLVKIGETTKEEENDNFEI